MEEEVRLKSFPRISAVTILFDKHFWKYWLSSEKVQYIPAKDNGVNGYLDNSAFELSSASPFTRKYSFAMKVKSKVSI